MGAPRKASYGTMHKKQHEPLTLEQRQEINALLSVGTKRQTICGMYNIKLHELRRLINNTGKYVPQVLEETHD